MERPSAHLRPRPTISQSPRQDAVPQPAPSTRLAGVSVSGARGEKAKVTLEDGLELVLNTEAFLAEGLRTGDPVDAQLRARLVEAGLRWQIREAALRLLSHRARSRGELATRLRRKDFPSRLIRPVLDELENRGWLDDAEFARSFIRDRLRLRPRGRRALLAELRKKGVEAGVAEAALDEIFADPEHSEREIAFSLAEAWLRRQPPALAEALLAGGREPTAQKAQRRFQGHLARRGIPGGLIREALDHLRNDPNA